jgi:hypothetical protein
MMRILSYQFLNIIAYQHLALEVLASQHLPTLPGPFIDANKPPAKLWETSVMANQKQSKGAEAEIED